MAFPRPVEPVGDVPAGLVGRSAELAWLGERLARAPAGTPRVLVVRGEPGIGTSALVTAAAQEAEAGGWRVFRPTGAEPVPTAEASAGRGLLVVLDGVEHREAVLSRALGELGTSRLPVVVLAAGPVAGILHEELLLDGLDTAAVREIAAARGVDLDESAAARLRRRSGGNPSYLDWLLLTTGAAGEALPAPLLRAVDGRLAELSDPARAALLAVAAAGDWRPVRETSGADAEVELRDAGLLDEHGYVRHGVVAERVLAGWWDSAPDVVSAVADELTRAAGDGVLAAVEAGEALLATARHRLGTDRVAALALAVARERLERHDPEAALRATGTALSLLDRLAEPAGAARGELQLLAGRAAVRSGRRPEAAAALGEAADIGRRTGQRHLVVRAALERPRLADQMHLDLELRGLLDEALELVTDDGTRARLLARRATELPFAADRERRRVCDEALALAERSSDPSTTAEVLQHRIVALNDPGLSADRLATAHRLAELAQRSGDPELRFDAALAVFAAALEAGRIDEVDATAATIRRHADRTGAVHHVAHALLREAALAFVRGRFDQASEKTDEAVRAATSAGLADAARMAGSLVTSIRHMTGDPAGAEIMRARAASDPLPGFVVGLFLHQAGHHAEARHEVRRGMAQRSLDRAALWLGSLAAGAEIADRLGDPAPAAAVLDQLRAAGGTLAVTGGGVLCLGPNEQFVGHALSALGNYDEAIECFRKAVERSRRLGFAPFVVRGTVGLARALVRRDGPGDRARAERHLLDAREQAAILGMRAVPAMIDDVLARHGASTTSVPVRLARSGDIWNLQVGERITHLRASKGLVQLAALLAVPGREIPSAQLAGTESGPAAAVRREVLDEEARRAYRRRLAELDEQRRAATALGDHEAEALAEREQDALVAELRRLTGLGGRGRTFSDEDERARVNVTRTLRAAVERVFAAEADFGLHLAQSIRTGIRCVYAPEDESWEIEVDAG